jgi:hypothetical protein
VFSQAYKRSVPMLGFDSRELLNSNGKSKDTQREKENSVKNDVNSCQSIPPTMGCPCRSIYRAGQGSYHNALNVPNHLPRQWSTRSGEGVIQSITLRQHFTMPQ